jgi:integrase
MCQLTPDSVDTENWVITGGIKTEAGKDRLVPIHLSARPIVTRWMEKGYKTLFADEKGNPLDKDKWGTRFERAMKTIFKDVDVVPYTTRHTCASILHAAGADPLSIAKIMGHKDYKITADVYTHIELDELKAAMETLA